MEQSGSKTSSVITERLMEALKEFSSRVSHIDVVSITSREGFPILGYSPSGQLQDDELAVVSSRVDTLGKSVRSEIQRGGLDAAFVETAEGFFIVAKAGQRGLLTVIFRTGANRDYVLPAVKELASRVGRLLEGQEVRWRELVRAAVRFTYIPSALLNKFTQKVHETLMPAVAGRIIYETGAEFSRDIAFLLKDEINPKYPLDHDEFTNFVSAVIDIVTNGTTDIKMLARTPKEFLTTVKGCVFCPEIGQEVQCKFMEGIIDGLYLAATGKNFKVKETITRQKKEADCELIFVPR